MRLTTERPLKSWYENKTSGCEHEGKLYEDGSQVPSKGKCEHCYCMRNEIVCAIQECRPPCEGCIPIWSDNDSCCPEKYECCKIFFRREIFNEILNFIFDHFIPK